MMCFFCPRVVHKNLWTDTTEEHDVEIPSFGNVRAAGQKHHWSSNGTYIIMRVRVRQGVDDY